MISMTETTKKTNKVMIALALLCIATIIGLNISIITYYSDVTAKNKQIQTLNEDIVTLQTQIQNLTSPTIGAPPRLITLGMNYTDIRTNPSNPYLQISGYVVNVGQSKANNCTIQISAIQTGNSTAIDTAKVIDSLSAGMYEKIDVQIPYTGQPLVAFSSNLEWQP
jgi:predicted histidine transporter YuiF (NhaC family)